MKKADREYIYSSKRYILLGTAIFLLSIITGVEIAVENPDLAEKYFEDFEKSYSWIKDINIVLIVFVIFVNNAIIGLVALALGAVIGMFLEKSILKITDEVPPVIASVIGVVSVGVPLYIAASNGIGLSLLLYFFAKERGTSFVLAMILPHGIIEIPMILLCVGTGLRLGHRMYLSLRGTGIEMNKELKQGFLLYVRFIFPLFFVAALIETFISPLIAIFFVV